MGTMACRKSCNYPREHSTRELDNVAQLMTQASLSANTRRAYLSIIKKFLIFIRRDLNVNNAFPATSMHVKSYLAHLFQIGLSPPTLLTHTSAIAFVHKIAGYQDPTNNFFIKRMLTGACKLKSTPDTRQPFLPHHIKSITASIKALQQSSYIKAMLNAMILLAYNAMLRVGEITAHSLKANNLNIIKFQHIHISSKGLIIHMQAFKHSQNNQVHIKIPEHQKGPLCPVKALRAFVAVRGQGHGPLFVFQNGDPVTCHFFNDQLNILITMSGLQQGKYSSHSLRIGGATTAIMYGASEAQLKVMGRWKSNAFRKYIRAPIICNPTNH